MKKYNNFKIGDTVICEYDEVRRDKSINKMITGKHRMTGVIIDKLNDLFDNMIQIHVTSGSHFDPEYADVPSDICFLACPFCGGFGEIIEPAKQQGSDVVDEVTLDCRACDGSGFDSM